MIDMTPAMEPKSDQLNADDLVAGPRTVTVTGVQIVVSDGVKRAAISFQGDNGRPFKPCKTMTRMLAAAWGNDGSKYIGRSMTLYRDPEVIFGGAKVGGIRISHLSHIESEMRLMLTATRGKRAPYQVNPLRVDLGEVSDDFDLDEILADAHDAARKGTEAFREFWNTDAAKDARSALQPYIAEFQKAAKLADEAGANLNDPFGLPDVE